MKVGDRVNIIRLDESDEYVGGLYVGLTGTIASECGAECENEVLETLPDVESTPVFNVLFDEPITGMGVNLNPDGTYQMFNNQLEVVESN